MAQAARPRRRATRQKNKNVKYTENSDSSDIGESSDFDPHNSSDDQEDDGGHGSSKRKTISKPRMLDMLKSPTLRKRKSNSKATSPSKRKAKPKIAPRSVHRVNAIAAITPLRRREQERSTPATAYELARERLHVSAVPDSLPCREVEFSDIMGFLESAVEAGTGTCVYISGVPGTGKTATVLEVMRHLQYKAEQQELPEFDFVEINGMKVTDPNQAYSILWECLNKSDGGSSTAAPRRVTSAHALDLLEARFSAPDDRQKTTVVLMDELDLLVTKKQTVMYNFFEWPNRPNSKLIVVAIANTMDLPERMLTNKISSRMGLTRINFQPYTYQQLYQIVESRLEGIDAFETEAVEFAARKVSAVSGDARRALDICRRAVEIVESRQYQLPAPGSAAGDKAKNTHVTIGIINDTIKEMLASPTVSFLQACALHQKLFLVSVMLCVRRSGLGDVEFGDAANYHMQACRWHHVQPPTTSDLMRVCESLGQARALVIEGGRMDLAMRMSLNISEQDIVMGCKGDKVVGKLLNNG
ncbi:P-loop containing nucleoside triphosphate hydrolase protein [Zychaea mexicana]|uniref:P-loop containing nucleoside triphosphate hydrolase protein n=1 Tax=Zychaea mexicana TaxID=64656 RepID=UPI0022FE87D2|nr:P-loop containing nucleoside triphosphate hydrolase protein [Zychaea mexicana]KAI9497187.1 P-loop containing nucleoside triphosphate hydrolase protein [Zychaea mexicana]